MKKFLFQPQNKDPPLAQRMYQRKKAFDKMIQKAGIVGNVPVDFSSSLFFSDSGTIIPPGSMQTKLVSSKIQAFLVKKKWTRLGSGYYSTVYGKNGYDKVIKVTRTQDKWIDYIHWASKKGYTGTFAPKVYSYKRYDDGSSVSLMERLDKTGHQIGTDSDLYPVKYLLEPGANTGHKTTITLLDLIIPGMEKFLIDMREDFGKDRRFDLHQGNYMLRKDGSFVVVDPVTGGLELKSTRLKAKDFSSAVRSFIDKMLEENEISN